MASSAIWFPFAFHHAPPFSGSSDRRFLPFRISFGFILTAAGLVEDRDHNRVHPADYGKFPPWDDRTRQTTEAVDFLIADGIGRKAVLAGVVEIDEPIPDVFEIVRKLRLRIILPAR
nr:hypothetical protein [Xaviernesmea oryzae]